MVSSSLGARPQDHLNSQLTGTEVTHVQGYGGGSYTSGPELPNTVPPTPRGERAPSMICRSCYIICEAWLKESVGPAQKSGEIP